MRSLEEWFKYVESFDHTEDQPASKQIGRTSANGETVNATFAPPAAVNVPDGARLPKVTQNYNQPSPAGAVSPFRMSSARPAPAQPAPPPQAAQAAPMRPRQRARQAEGESAGAAPKETREQLLSRLLDPVLTLEEAAQVLNVCPTTIRRYTNKGLLQHYRTSGNQRRFRLSHVLRFLDESGGELEIGTLERQAQAMSQQHHGPATTR